MTYCGPFVEHGQYLVFSEKRHFPTHFLLPIGYILVLPIHFEEASYAPVDVQRYVNWKYLQYDPTKSGQFHDQEPLQFDDCFPNALKFQYKQKYGHTERKM